ncbi:MAG: Tm-1-like ATP-binding domain-containing protein [Thermodesulfobacteriota bacterium]|nr:Tm-1-like ATP-binding domain-containing protein [Thermodesulfobacteriota bacterium]
MSKVIVILVMAEEKWEEADFLKRQIELRGHKAVIMDIGLTGEPQGECDITRQDIITASGRDPEEIALLSDRGKRMPAMVDGGRQKIQEMHNKGQLSGVMSLGGTTGTQMGTGIMKSLAFGFPKIAVSSTASIPGFCSRYIGTSDITLMHTVVEFAGINKMLENVLSRAAGAICGMVDASVQAPVSLEGGDEKPLIAMTHFGPCENCAVAVRKLIEKDYQVIGFSAAGTGDRAMEEMIGKQNIFSAVIDLAPGGVGEDLLGFMRSAGPDRLEAAGKIGLPQIIATSGVNFGSPLKRNYKPDYESRKKYRYDSARTFVRLSADEMTMVADKIADKLNMSKGPVKVLIPLGGWSSVDKKDTDFYDKDLDMIFVEELKKKLRFDIEAIEIDADLDTVEFAQAVAKAFNEITDKGNR